MTRANRVEALTEADFRAWILATATANGWLAYSHDESNVAAPNLVLVRDGTLILARVKAQRANVTDAQAEWLTELERVPTVMVATWRPSEMADVFALLSAPARVREVA